MLSILKSIFSITKKILLVFVVFFFIISLFIYFMNQDKIKLTVDPTKEGRKSIYKILNDKELNKTKEGKMFIALYRMINCRFVGEACTDNPKDGDNNFNKSILGFASKLIVSQYVNPPASGVYWVSSSLEKAGLIPKAYAAEGIGFAALKPFTRVWKAFRDFSFVILVVILVAIGFMIMFRMKINAQTVISVENSLPRIVIALLLITFSYPIAGFLIDLMYVFMMLVISVLSTVNIDPYTTNKSFDLINQYVAAGPGKLFPMEFHWFDTGNYLLSILPVGTLILKGVAGYLSAFGLSRLMWSFAGIDRTTSGLNNLAIQAVTFGFSPGKIPGDWAWMFIYWFIAAIFSTFALPLVISFLVALTVLFIFFRIFFMLISTYIQTLLLILFSPIILLFEAFPGRGAFSWWFKNLFANLITFPFVLLIIMISDIIIKLNAQVGTDKFWAPPFLYPLDQTAITFLFGLGLYLILPDFVKLIKEMLGVKPLPINIGLGTFFTGTAALLGAQGGLGAVSSLTQIPFIGPAILSQIRKTPQGEKLLSNVLGQTQEAILLQRLLEAQKSK